MAKIKRFYLLIAALIYSKSYMITDAYATTNYTKTDAECIATETLMDYIYDQGYGGTAVINTSWSEMGLVTWMGNQDEIVDDFGNRAWISEVWENDGLEISECIENNYDLLQCSYAMGWGCGAVSCIDGRGWNDSEKYCELCADGTYQSLGYFYGEDGQMYGEYCASCPTYSASDGTTKYPSSINGAETINDCYIASGAAWSFSDTSGKGGIFFGDGTQDCFYDGVLAVAGTY
ncbi:MAG: hypothetical protein IJX89_02970 [Alphaproteobacteria bacterium]|nr:hypothetical protein [Alphaproteobacteria bacterium]